MDIELDPPRGITGFPIGMPAGEVKEAAAMLGPIKVRNDGSAERFRRMKVLALHSQFEIAFHLEDGKTLTAVEVWIPRSGPEKITVSFRGIDVFSTPARELLGQILSMGFTIDHHEPLHPTVHPRDEADLAVEGVDPARLHVQFGLAAEPHMSDVRSRVAL